MLIKLPHIIPVVDMVVIPLTTVPSSIITALVVVVTTTALATNTATTPLTISIMVVVAVLLVATLLCTHLVSTVHELPIPLMASRGGQARGGIGGHCIRQPGGGLHPNPAQRQLDFFQQ